MFSSFLRVVLYFYSGVYIYIYIYIYIYVHVCVCVCLSRPPHMLDVTLGQFFNWSFKDFNLELSFFYTSCNKDLSLPYRLPIAWWRNNWIHTFPKVISAMGLENRLTPRFEHWWPCLSLMKIIMTPEAPPFNRILFSIIYMYIYIYERKWNSIKLKNKFNSMIIFTEVYFSVNNHTKKRISLSTYEMGLCCWGWNNL